MDDDLTPLQAGLLELLFPQPRHHLCAWMCAYDFAIVRKELRSVFEPVLGAGLFMRGCFGSVVFPDAVPRARGIQAWKRSLWISRLVVPQTVQFLEEGLTPIGNDRDPLRVVSIPARIYELAGVDTGHAGQIQR